MILFASLPSRGAAAVARARVAERREGDCEKAQHFLSGTTRIGGIVATRRDARVETRWYAARDCFARLTRANGVAPRVWVDERWTASDIARGALWRRREARAIGCLFACLFSSYRARSNQTAGVLRRWSV